MDERESSPSQPETPAQVAPAPLQARILEHLARRGPSPCSEVGDALGEPWKRVSEELRKLVAAGKVKRARQRRGYPRYSIQPKRVRVAHPPITAGEVRDVYFASDGGATRRLHAALQRRGRRGKLAALLLRAQKKSDRAKDYRGEWSGAAYSEKDQSLCRACALLHSNPDLVARWGWGRDPNAEGYEDVLYVDLATGQVSFHSGWRYRGPDYPGEWDGAEESRERILRFAEDVLSEAPR